MMAENKTTYIFCAGFFALAAYLQLNSLVNTDNAWLIDSAQMLLSGQNLYTDYVETNPPFIVYFTALPLILGDALGLAAPESYNIFVLVLAAFSFVLSCRQLKSNNLRITLILLYVIFPAYSFGQREHLLVLFIAPYFLTLLNNSRPSVTATALMITGILLKPYFVLFLVFFVLWEKLELKQKLFSIRNFTLGFICILYVVLIWFFERDYIEKTLPMLLQYYDSFYYKRLNIYLKALIFAAPLLLIIIKKANLRLLDNKLIFVLMAASTAGITAAVQDKGWVNHYLPLHFFMIFALVLLIENCFNKLAANEKRVFISVLSAVYLLLIVLAFKNNFGLICNYTKFKVTENVQVIESKAPNGRALILGFNLNSFYPELLYSSASLGWNYPSLWMLPGMYDGMQNINSKNEVMFRSPAKQGKDERAIFESVVNYVITQKPEIIVIPRGSVGSYSKKSNGKKLSYKFNIQEYFMQDKRFAAEFNNYKLQRKFLGKSIYVRRG